MESITLVLARVHVLELARVCGPWWGWRTEGGDWWLVEAGLA